jgi:cytochrome c
MNLRSTSSLKKLSQIMLPVAVTALMSLSANVLAADVDADAAQALAKKSNCFKCHSVDKKKDGPSFKETAAKYKGKADAEEKIFKHLTTNPKIKIDGKEEEHEGVKSKNDAEIKNLARWVLSR